jgi:hypothetical protein
MGAQEIHLGCALIEIDLNCLSKSLGQRGRSRVSCCGSIGPCRSTDVVSVCPQDIREARLPTEIIHIIVQSTMIHGELLTNPLQGFKICFSALAASGPQTPSYSS